MDTRPLTPDDWPRIELLFGTNGACGGCWCMYWRHPGSTAYTLGKGEPNRRAFEALVTSGRATGVLAFEDGAPVGWCAVAPRVELARVAVGRALRRDAPVGTWSLHCFYVPAKWRGKGVASSLIGAATTYAFERGAVEVEGYPVTPKAGRTPAAFAWTGVDALFEQAGYAPIPREGRAIWVRRASGAPRQTRPKEM